MAARLRWASRFDPSGPLAVMCRHRPIRYPPGRPVGQSGVGVGDHCGEHLRRGGKPLKNRGFLEKAARRRIPSGPAIPAGLKKTPEKQRKISQPLTLVRCSRQWVGVPRRTHGRVRSGGPTDRLQEPAPTRDRTGPIRPMRSGRAGTAVGTLRPHVHMPPMRCALRYQSRPSEDGAGGVSSGRRRDWAERMLSSAASRRSSGVPPSAPGGVPRLPPPPPARRRRRIRSRPSLSDSWSEPGLPADGSSPESASADGSSPPELRSGERRPPGRRDGDGSSGPGSWGIAGDCACWIAKSRLIAAS